MAPVPAAVSANQIIPGTPLPWCASFLRAAFPALRRGARPGNGQREGRPPPLSPERSGRRLSHSCHRT
jgi:hypothetical protein